MLLPDYLVRLPPAAALVVLCGIFQTSIAESLPTQTKTVDLRELHVLPWPAVETLAPRYPPAIHGLRLRQLNTVCGYLGGDPDLPATCSAGSHCAAIVGQGAIGCCPDEGPCTQGVFTDCIDSSSGPQSVLDPYIYTCQGDSVCYKNAFDGGYYQYGCGSSSNLATKVEASAPGQSALNLVSLSVALTADPTTLSEPTTIWTVSSTSSKTTTETTTSDGTSSETSSAESTSSETGSTKSESATAATTDLGSSQTAPAAPSSGESSSKNTGAIIGGTIGGVLGAILIIALVLLLLRRRRGNVREGPGPNQSTEYIKSPIDGTNGYAFAPVPDTREVAHFNEPIAAPVAYAHPGNRMQEYDNTIVSPYTARDSDEFSRASSGGMGGVAAGSAGPRLELDEIPLTRDMETYQPPTSDPPAPEVPAAPPAPVVPIAPLIRNEADISSPPPTTYIPRGDGGSALWHQNRQTTRNPTWM